MVRPAAGPEPTPPSAAALGRRAALALALFVAWWGLVVGVVLALGAVAWFVGWDSAPAVGGAVACVVVAAGVLSRAWPSAGRGPAPPPQPPAAAPARGAPLAAVCRGSGRHLPPILAVVPEANAYAGRGPGRLAGAGREMIALGIGILPILDVPTLRAVLAHELGHHRAGAVTLGRWVHGARAGLLRARLRSSEGHVLAGPFRWYARLFLQLSGSVSRQHELDADAFAASTVSPAYTAEALRRVSENAPLWEAYWRAEVVPLLDAGFFPPLVEGFEHYRRVVAPSPPERRAANPHDSHPPLVERLAALGNPSPPSPGEPLLSLVGDLRALEDAAVQAAISGRGTLRVVDAPGRRPGPGEVLLERVRWEDVARRVWLPRYAAEVATWGSRLGPDALHAVPRLRADPGELSAWFAARGPRVLSPLAAQRRHMDLLARALAVAMARCGWAAESMPGVPLTMVRGGARVDPSAAVLAADDATWPAQLEAWLTPQNCTPTDSVPP